MDALQNHAEPETHQRLTVTKAVILLFLGVVIVGLTAGIKALQPSAENFNARDSSVQTTSCRLILAPLSITTPIDQEIADQQALIRTGTSSRSALERLGWTFVKKARLSFDDGFYKLAEHCAACIETQEANAPDALLLRAHALQSLHRFGEAEAAARKLVSLREFPFDHGVLGDILIDQGKLLDGAAAYQKMVDLRPDLQSYARAAHVRWLTGDLAGAIDLMTLATAAGSPNDPEAAAWAFTRLALYQLQRGATKQALESCAAALSLQSSYAPAMLARGRALLALNRSADAVVEFQQAAKLNPLPEYQWALADALNITGNRDRAAEVESQITAQATEDARTLSLYLATRKQDLEGAVQLAEQELANRKDVFTYDALAWALATAGRPAEALPHITQALAQGTVDPRLYFHAGVIAALNADNKQAMRWLAKAEPAKQMLLPSEQVLLGDWRKKLRRKTLQSSSRSKN